MKNKFKLILIIILAMSVLLGATIFAFWADVVNTNQNNQNEDVWEIDEWRTPHDLEFMDSVGGIQSVVTYARNTMILTDAGEIWVFGDNLANSLGVNDMAVIGRPQRVTATPWSTDGAYIVDMALGRMFSVVLDSFGRLWQSGQLQVNAGTGSQFMQMTVFHRVAFAQPERFVSIAAGEVHFVALTEDGEVFTGGTNTDGQIGNGTQLTNHPQSQTLNRVNLNGAIATMISATARSSFAATESGVFVWGQNNEGQLGLGTQTRQDSPQLMTSFTGVPVWIESGIRTTFMMTTTGLYSWGHASGQLGRTASALQGRTPGRVNLPATAANNYVVSMSVGNTSGYLLLNDGRVLQSNQTDALVVTPTPANVEVIGVSNGNTNNAGTSGTRNEAGDSGVAAANMNNAVNFIFTRCGLIFGRGTARFGGVGNGFIAGTGGAASPTVGNYVLLRFGVQEYSVGSFSTTVASQQYIWQETVPALMLSNTLTGGVNGLPTAGSVAATANNLRAPDGTPRYRIFMGWYTTTNFEEGTRVTSLNMPNANTRVYARWTWNTTLAT